MYLTSASFREDVCHRANGSYGWMCFLQHVARKEGIGRHITIIDCDNFVEYKWESKKVVDDT